MSVVYMFYYGIYSTIVSIGDGYRCNGGTLGRQYASHGLLYVGLLLLHGGSLVLTMQIYIFLPALSAADI